MPAPLVKLDLEFPLHVQRRTRDRRLPRRPPGAPVARLTCPVRPQAGLDCSAAVYRDAGITNPREQIDVAELYVPFSWYEPMWLEGHELAAPGEGWKMTDDGTTAMTGSFPVNPSGGVLSSNPIGASGMIRFAEAALQVQGKAGEHQIEGAADRPRGRVRCDGAILRHGGAVGVAVALVGTDWSRPRKQETKRSRARRAGRRSGVDQ